MKKYLTDAEFIGQKFNHLTVIEKYHQSTCILQDMVYSIDVSN